MLQNNSIVLTATNPIRMLEYDEYNKLIEQEISEFMQIFDLDDDDDTRAPIIALLQNCGVEFDACSSCGAMPMDSNCNNARCQD